MTDIVCASCHDCFKSGASVCPSCGAELIYAGEDANVITSLAPDCLVHRLRGSDRLEPAVLLKEGRTNVKVATRLAEYAKPLTVPKSETYRFSAELLSHIQSLRNERTAAMHRYDAQIASYWQRLAPYYGYATHEPHSAPPAEMPSSSLTVTNE
ncbi:MAG: hypothetical protein J6B02_02260 [Selenomonadales bacterium]|nr:hypothetical protein [Selenomonadales bacterium]